MTHSKHAKHAKYATLGPAAGLLLALGLACDAGTKADAQADAKAAAAVDTKVAVKADVKADVQADVKPPAVGAAVVGGAVVVLKSVAEVEAALGKPIVVTAADLDLAGLVALVVEGKVQSAAELELLLNAPGGASHHLDLDVDGRLDYVQVVELRVDGEIRLELRAIPSSKLDASLGVVVGTLAIARAQAEGQLKVAASYGAAVTGGADFKFERGFAATFTGDAVVLADASAGAFLGWAVQVGRPAYTSVHVATADVTLGVDGAVQWGTDVSLQLAAARLAALRGALKVELAAPKLAAEVDADVKAGAKAAAEVGAALKHKAEAGVKVGGGVKTGGSVGGGVKVGGSVSVGGGLGGGLGGGGKVGGKAGGKAGAGIKIGR